MRVYNFSSNIFSLIFSHTCTC